MFEVDTWETSSYGEEKLIHDLFGDDSKRKRKKEKVPTQSPKTFGSSKEDVLMQIHIKEKKKKKIVSHFEGEITQTPKEPETSILKTIKSRKRSKKEVLPNNEALMEQDNTTNLDQRKARKKERKRKHTHNPSILEPSALNGSLEVKCVKKSKKEKESINKEPNIQQDNTTDLDQRKVRKKERKRAHTDNLSNSEKCVLEGFTEIGDEKKRKEDKVEPMQQDITTKHNEKKSRKNKKKKKKAAYDNAPLEGGQNNPQESKGMLTNILEKYEKGTNSDSMKKLSLVSSQLSVNEVGKNLSSGKKSRKSELQKKLKQKLESSRFRWINEQLYTIPGEKALKMFKDDQSLFDVYHQGFRRQVEHWPINPVDAIIYWVKERSPSLVLADFGCGEAIIAQSVPNRVYSFDLVAKNKLVTACNMAKVPLQATCIDVAIYCLSLMGTDLEAFLSEGYRVLKPGGTLKIAEVVSRMKVNTFIPAVCQLGFKLDHMDDSNKMFILLDFKKDHHSKKSKENTDLSSLQLQPCIYKRR